MSTRSRKNEVLTLVGVLLTFFVVVHAFADGPVNGGASGKSPAFVSTGSSPTGNTGTCSTTVTMAGGSTAGTWSSTAICAIAGTIILSAMPAAPHGYACAATDQTTAAVVLQQTATSTTSVTFTVRATATVANDVINFLCLGY